MNIPVWESAPINDLIDGLVAGVSVRSTKGLLQGPSILKTSCISAGIFEPDEAKPILRSDLTRARCMPVAGSIIISRMNTPALVGEVGYVNRDYPALFLPDRLWLARPKRGRQTDMRWLAYYLSSDEGSRAVRELATGTSGSMKNIPKKRFLGLILPVPPPEEQKRIADVLDDATHMIGTLERLIVKKQALKQGLIQQLLTGKMRLPEFKDPWNEVRLGDHVTYVKTVALPRAQLNNSSPLRYLHYGDIHTRTSALLDAAKEAMPRVSSHRVSNAGRLQPGDLVFADASEDPNGVGKSVEISDVPVEGVVAGLHTIAARFDKTVLVDGFKAYLQFIPDFRDSLLRLAAGTKVLATTRSYISTIVVSLPPAEEQRAIAKVLNDCEQEIIALRRRLTKAKAVKQGMMQELLAGRTRLPVLESVA